MHFHDIHRAPRGTPAIGSDIHHAAVACALAHEDRAVLLACLDRSPGHDPWVLAVAGAKVALARIFAAADLPADRIAVGTRLAFGIGDRRPEPVVLAPWDEEPAPLGRLALRTRLGIAMLGMREGAHVDVPRHDGTIERLTIHDVLYRTGAQSAPGTSPANDNRGGERKVRP